MRQWRERTHSLVATVPCDSPFLPLDLVQRLMEGLTTNDAELAVARTFDQPHPVFCFVRATVLPHLTAFLDNGGRKIDAWYATLKVIEVRFDDEADAFRNINTREELGQVSGAGVWMRSSTSPAVATTTFNCFASSRPAQSSCFIRMR
jgi:molybdopterin-guanine dinucleotide biosynthesis protein A